MAPRGEHVEQHLGTIASLHARADEKVSAPQRAVERFARRVGRPGTLVVLVTIVMGWTVVNALAGHRAVDPAPFFWLQGGLGLYAALITTVVLTAQNRQQERSRHDAYVELQVNLSAEQKTAKVISLLEELRRDLPNVTNRRDHEAERMAQANDTAAVASALEEALVPSDRGRPS